MNSEAHWIGSRGLALIQQDLSSLLLQDWDGLVTAHGDLQLVTETDQIALLARRGVQLGHLELKRSLGLGLGIGCQPLGLAKLLHSN